MLTRSVKRDPVVEHINTQLGRPLRVLHIGNIANNAYNNAKIQRQYGIEADVICHDYYHVMGTPEWEDGELTTIVDPDFPNWWVSNLNGFKRPEWYVQGPLALCLEYLSAYRRKKRWRRQIVSLALETAYLNLLRGIAQIRGEKWRNPKKLKLSLFGYGIVSSLLVGPDYLRARVQELHVAVLWPLIAASVVNPPRIVGASFVLSAYQAARHALGKEKIDHQTIRRMVATAVPPNSMPSWRAVIVNLIRIVSAMGMSLPIVLCHLLFGRISEWLRAGPADDDPQGRAKDVIARILADDPIGAADDPDIRSQLTSYVVDTALEFARILKHYDIVQGYSVDGLIPLVNGHRAFASYEHGTLRRLPFERSVTGLKCHIVYRNSPAVFITNTDVLPSVERLGLDPKCVHYLPHAFDDLKLARWRITNFQITPPNDEVVFFAPARQHWKDDDPSLSKGNDLMLRAAGRIWAKGRRFRLVLVEWGQDVTEAKRLIDELGFHERVRWVSPMGKQHLWRAYCESHAVLDQFVLPALGGVAFEALALGRRLITRTDQPTLERFFGAAPPVLPAGSVDQIEASLISVLDDPDDAQGLGARGRDWIDAYHSARRIVEIQAHVYRDLLDRRSKECLDPQILTG